MTQAEIVIARFGSVEAICDATGWPRHRVDNAKRVGVFQQRDHPKLLEAARRVDAPLSPIDFVAHLANLAPVSAG
jgi:hypothetical protein